MILFFYGVDTLRSHEEISGLKNRFHAKYGKGASIREIDVEEEGCEKLFSEVTTMPLFAEMRFIIVKGFLKDASEKDQKRMEKIIPVEEKNKNVVLCFLEKGKPKKTKLFKLLVSQRNAKEFPAMSAYELSRWLKKRAQNRRYLIEPQALEMLVIRSHGDTWWLANTLDKLGAYVNSRAISAQDVQAMTQLRIDPDIFKTIDAVAEKNALRALTLLHQHLANGENELYLLSMINYQFSNLVQVKELLDQGMNQHEIQKTTGMHPFVVEKTIRQAKNFSAKSLRVIFEKLASIDGRIKTGKIDPGVALDLLVVGLTA